MTRWNHARKGIIEGIVIAENWEWVDIELSEKARVADWPDPFRSGYRSISGDKGCIVRYRRSLLTELEVDDETERDN